MMIPSQISYPASQGAYYIPGQVRLGAWSLEATDPYTSHLPHPDPPVPLLFQRWDFLLVIAQSWLGLS